MKVKYFYLNGGNSDLGSFDIEKSFNDKFELEIDTDCIEKIFHKKCRECAYWKKVYHKDYWSHNVLCGGKLVNTDITLDRKNKKLILSDKELFSGAKKLSLNIESSHPALPSITPIKIELNLDLSLKGLPFILDESGGIKANPTWLKFHKKLSVAISNSNYENIMHLSDNLSHKEKESLIKSSQCQEFSWQSLDSNFLYGLNFKHTVFFGKRYNFKSVEYIIIRTGSDSEDLVIVNDMNNFFDVADKLRIETYYSKTEIKQEIYDKTSDVRYILLHPGRTYQSWLHSERLNKLIRLDEQPEIQNKYGAIQTHLDGEYTSLTYQTMSLPPIDIDSIPAINVCWIIKSSYFLEVVN